MTMGAAVLHEPGTPVVVEEVELAPPRDREVLVRVAAAGVCHSDVRLADGALGAGRFPIVLGHEGAGVVEAVGEGVTHVRPGRPRRLLLRSRVRRLPPLSRRADDALRVGRRALGRRDAPRRQLAPQPARRDALCSTRC